ncbi:MAG: hypothetical protein V1659_05940 [Candidatus Woesearchaeota archaeon]
MGENEPAIRRDIDTGEIVDVSIIMILNQAETALMKLRPNDEFGLKACLIATLECISGLLDLRRENGADTEEVKRLGDQASLGIATVATQGANMIHMPREQIIQIVNTLDRSGYLPESTTYH